MKQLEQDPCANCLYGKKRNQHTIPETIKNFNRVTPKEAFGSKVKSNKSKPKVSGAKPKVSGAKK